MGMQLVKTELACSVPLYTTLNEVFAVWQKMVYLIKRHTKRVVWLGEQKAFFKQYKIITQL